MFCNQFNLGKIIRVWNIIHSIVAIIFHKPFKSSHNFLRSDSSRFHSNSFLGCCEWTT